MHASLLGPGRAPAEILAALRSIDPEADLIHLGGYEWLLGVKRPNPAAREKIERQLKALSTATIGGGLDPADKARVQTELGKEFQLLQYCAEGFRPIQMYVVNDPTAPDSVTFGEVVQDFRLRDHNWRTRREAAFAELRDAISADEQGRWRTNLVREFFEQEGASLHRYVMRKAKGFWQRVKAPFTSTKAA